MVRASLIFETVSDGNCFDILNVNYSTDNKSKCDISLIHGVLVKMLTFS